MTTLNELTQVFRQVFEDDDLDLIPEMTANDVEGWDSLSHVVLILAVEDHFKINFSQNELLTFKNVGDLKSAIESKIV